MGARNILTTPMRRLMAFILQQPILVSSQLQALELMHLCSLCETLKVKGASELKLLLQQIKECPQITSAQLVERFRGTEREHYINLLVNAPLGLTLPQGVELDQIARLEYFVRLIVMVLIEPLQQRSALLTLNADKLKAEELNEMVILKRELHQIESLGARAWRKTYLLVYNS